MAHPSRRGRLVRRASVLFGLGFLLAVVPVPSVTFAIQSAGAAEAVTATSPMTPEQLVEAQQAVGESLGSDRVVASESGMSPFTAIGFTFDAQPSAPVLVRVRDARGALGAWTKLESQDTEGPDAGSAERARSGTEPLWVRDATGYEVSFPGDVSGARVVVVRDELHRSTVDATPFADAAVPPPFGITLRSSWGARAPKDTSYGTTVKLAVVHHSDSGNNYSSAEVPGILRSIQAFHMDGRGWSDIAYNFVVDKFGGIWEGRGGGIDRPVIGAHAQGFNTNTVGVMVIGDYTQATPSAASLESVAKVIGWKMFLSRNDPANTVTFTSGGSPRYPAGQVVYIPGVVGHQDVGLTSCPGSIESSLSGVRARAQEWTSWIRATSVPVGNLESLIGGSGTVTASGWAADPSTSAPVGVLLTAGSVTVGGAANRSRPDVQAVYPAYGGSTGFSLAATGVAPGLQLACVTALDGDGGMDLGMGCARVYVADPTGLSPTGNFSSAAGGVGELTVGGWSSDADGPAPREVTLAVDGLVRYRGPSSADGTFLVRIPRVLGGRRDVCLGVTNGGRGSSVTAACLAVDVRGANPVGNVDGFAIRENYVAMSGWALDLETSAPIPVDVVLDGTRVFRAVGGRPRPDVGSAYGTGESSGFGQELWGVPAGSHTLCAVARNVGLGSDQTIGCRRFVVK